MVLPGATATEFWGIAGTPVEHLPQEIVMSTAETVDASLAGLDAGEFVTIPSPPNVADWEAYESARQRLLPNFRELRQPPGTRESQIDEKGAGIAPSASHFRA